LADKDIKQRIVLEGEKEYSAAIKEAQRNLKVLRSELKAETAELGANATAQQKNEAKVKSLQKQIKEQEKIVKTYQAALAEVKEKYGDDEEAIAKWENKLNEARATLANMKNSVDSAGESVKNFSQDAQLGVIASKSFADTLKSVGDVAGSVATSIESVFTSIIGTITGAIGALWGELMNIAARSDNYLDLASFLGTNATDVQKWDRAMKSVGGDLSTVTSMVSRLRYGGKADKVTEWFGVSAENYKDDLQYFEAVMSRMVAMKDEMVANGTWDDAMSEIFGAKKVQEIDGILSDWKDIQEGLAQFNVENGGVGMSQDEIETMGEMYNKALLLQETWEAFKESFLAGAFGQIGLTLVGDAQNILDALIKYVETGDESALNELEAGMEQFFRDLGEAIETAAKVLDEVGAELADSDNGYVAMIGRVLQEFSGVLEWLTDPSSLEQVKGFFTTMLEIWAGARIVQAASNLLSLATNLGTLLGVFTSVPSGGLDFGNLNIDVDGAWGGLAAAIAKALTSITVSVALAAILCYPLLNRLIHGESDEEKAAREAMENISKVVGPMAAGGAKPQSGDGGVASKSILEYALFGHSDTMDKRLKEIEDEEYAAFDAARRDSGIGPHGYVDVVSDEVIHKDRRTGKTDVEMALDNLTEQLGNLYRRMQEGGGSLLMDSEWWKNRQGGLSSSDIAAFQSVPGMMAEAVASGVSGVRVTLDGYAVGSLVAPYVSQMIARDYT